MSQSEARREAAAQRCLLEPLANTNAELFDAECSTVPELWEYSFEVVRLFQNAVAAGESFLEHCRSSARRRYRGRPSLVEFEQHFATSIEGSPVRMFVKELRGHLLHKESITPVVSRGLVDFSDPYDAMSTIELGTDSIRIERDRWKGKNPKAVEYLDRLGPTINIRKLVDEYRLVVEKFGDWLLQREKRMNSEVLQESRRLRGELVAHLDEVTGEEIRVFDKNVTRASWFVREDIVRRRTSPR